MAYVANQPKQGQTIEDKNKELMLNTGASSSTGISQLGGQARPAAQNQPKFQNIQGMLGANKAAGSELVGGITSRIGGEIAQQKQKVGKAESDVGATAQAIQAGKDTTSGALASLNKDLTEDKQVAAAGIAEGTKNTFGGKDYTYTGGQWKDTTGGSLAIPTSQPQPEATPLNYSTLSGENKDSLTNLAGYTTGTTQQKQGEDLTSNITKFQDIGAAAQKQAAQRMNQLGSAEGRTSLLQEMISRGQRPYSSGASALDQAFMQRQGGTAFKQQQSDLRTRQKELSDKIQAGQLTGDIAKQTLSESKGLSKDVQKALGITEEEFTKAQEKEREDALTQSNIMNSALEKMLSGNASTLSHEEDVKLRDMLRLQNIQLGERLYGMTKEDLLPYVNKADVDIKTENMIDSDELKKYQTLQRLMGRDADSGIFKKVDNEYNKGSVSQDLMGEISRRKDLYTDELGQNAFNALSALAPHFAANEYVRTTGNPFVKSDYTYKDLEDIAKLAVGTNWSSGPAWAPNILNDRLINSGYIRNLDNGMTWRATEALYNKLYMLDDMRKRHGYDVTLGGLPVAGKGFTPKF